VSTAAPERAATLVWAGNGHLPVLGASTLSSDQDATLLDHFIRPKPGPRAAPGWSIDTPVQPFRDGTAFDYFVATLGQVGLRAGSIHRGTEPPPDGGRRTRMRDGVVDPYHWARAVPRLLWILRETNNPAGTWRGNAGAGLGVTLFDWSHRMHKNGTATWRTVAEGSYGLLEPEAPLGDFDGSPSKYLPALRSIAVINVKKTGGGSTSQWRELEEAYDRNEEMLWSQIAAIGPDVVIGGNVLWLFRRRLGWTAPKLPRVRSSDAYASTVRDGVRWIHAHHPAFRGSHRGYVERIRRAAASTRGES